MNMSSTSIDPRYPIGRYQPQPFSEQQRNEWLNDIRLLPTLLEHAVSTLDEHQYDTPYREGGWTIKQLVHHVADSHMNGYTRLRLGLTETNPTVKPYEEKEWARLRDSEVLPANISITLLHALHTRWYETLKAISGEQWDRTIFHPVNKEMTLWNLFGQYSWHGRHHLAHITEAKKAHGWR